MVAEDVFKERQSRHQLELAAAVSHLARCDPRFAALAAQYGPPKLEIAKNLFVHLVKMITYQQLAGSAAQKVFGRVLSLLGATASDASFFTEDAEVHVTPARIQATGVTSLREVGLSMRKAEYICGLADAVSSKSLDLDAIHNEPDEAVTRQVTAVRGLGPWTADMFKMVGSLLRWTLRSVLRIQCDPADSFFSVCAGTDGHSPNWRFWSEERLSAVLCLVHAAHTGGNAGSLSRAFAC